MRLPAYCGTIAWGTVIEFEILAFSDSTYQADTIGVIFTCLEFYGEGFFEVGKTYTVTLADENQAHFNWLVPNESILVKYPLTKKLWAIEAQKQRF